MENKLGNDPDYWHCEHPLMVHLQTTLDLWQQSREKYWTNEIGPKGVEDGKASFGKIKKLADALLETSEHVGDSTSLEKVFEEVDLKEYFDKCGLIFYVQEYLEASLTWNGLVKVEGCASRLLSLLEVLRHIENLALTPPLADFLQLVTRSYIWGFDTECVILCRSAMEMAIRDKVTYEMCEKALGKRFGEQQGYTLADRLLVAKLERLIDDDMARIADKVRRRGNTALHKDPNAIKDVLGTIREAVRVIAAFTGK